MTTHDKAALVAQIKTAFAARTYPGDANLVEDDCLGAERIRIVNAFQDKHWDTFSAPELRAQQTALSFFTPQALAYYLPAFLIATIEHTEVMDVAGDSVILTLTAPAQWMKLPDDVRPIFEEDFEHHVEELTPEEKAVFHAFLEYMRDVRDEDLAREALDGYWKHF